MDSALRYRKDIDGLRALAVLAVMGFHAFPETLRGGFIGVDVFFVISGYLITGILLRSMEAGQFSFHDFYARRIRRIFPALLLVLGACFAFGWVALLADEYAQLGKHMAAGAGFGSNFVLWQERGYFDAAALTKPLLHLWSLAIEEQFYVLWPLVLWGAWRARLNVAWVIVALAAASFAANIVLQQSLAMDFYAPFTRAWELLLGAMLASSTASKARSNFLSCIAFGLLMVGLALTTSAQPYPGMLAVLPTVGTVLLIASGEGALVNRLLAQRPFVAIGRISYPLYLWHWPLLSFAYIIYSDGVPAGVRWALLAASFVLATATYHWVERPIRRSAQLRPWAKLLVLCMLGMGLLGLHIYGTDGYRFRTAAHYVNNRYELLRTPKVDVACLRYLAMTASPTSYCRFTDAHSPRTVAMIGDSQAHAAYPGIAAMLHARGINTVLLANEGCPPFADDRPGNCAQQMRRSLVQILGRKDIERVLIFSRGPTYLNVDEVSGAAPRFTYVQMRTMLQSTIDQLHGVGKQVFYVLENAQTRIQPAGCVPRPLRHTTRSCDIARGDVDAEHATYRRMARELRHVTLIDQLQTLCDASRCHVVIDGVLMYAVVSLLSVAGSKFQAERLFAPYFP